MPTCIFIIINTYTDIFIKYLKISKCKHTLYIMSVHPYCVFQGISMNSYEIRVDKSMLHHTLNNQKYPSVVWPINVIFMTHSQ